jgi:hypothetical protein
MNGVTGLLLGSHIHVYPLLAWSSDHYSLTTVIKYYPKPHQCENENICAYNVLVYFHKV